MNDGGNKEMSAKGSNGTGPGKARLLLLILAAVVALLVVVGCGSSSSSSSSSETTESSEETGGTGGSEEAEEEPAEEGEEEAEAGGEKQEGFKVGVLTPGTENDGSWGQAISEGAKEAGEKYGAEVTIAANLEEPAQYQQQGLALAQQGYNVIINANAAMGAVTEELAEKFPDVKFGQIAVGIEGPPENVASNTPQLPVATFQAGVLAAAMSESGTLGTIGGYEFPALTSEMEGFALGARYENPEIKILRTYINTWTDAGKAKAAAQAQVSQGADIIFSATDQATQGMYQLAESGSGLKYVIPQYIDKSEQAPNVVLTSAVYNLQGATGSFIEMYGDGAWKAENVEFGIEDGVDLAPNPEMKIPAEAMKKLEEVEKDIASGKLKIPSIEELGENESAEGIDLKTLEG
jgi:basic membrane protein A and related proteins